MSMRYIFDDAGLKRRAMFIRFLPFGNDAISVESRHLIIVYSTQTCTQSIQKQMVEHNIKCKYTRPSIK